MTQSPAQTDGRLPGVGPPGGWLVTTVYLLPALEPQRHWSCPDPGGHWSGQVRLSLSRRERKAAGWHSEQTRLIQEALSLGPVPPTVA